MNRHHAITVLEADASDLGTDRRVRQALGIVAILALLMLVFEIVDHLGMQGATADRFWWGEIVSEVLALVALAWCGPLALREMEKRRQGTLLALDARAQVEVLFQMTDMLQSALGYGDANAVLRASAAKLMPGLGGALYIFNNSGDRLELSSSWARQDDRSPAEIILPAQCWALKRGKPHLNQADPDALCCEHHEQGGAELEIPMMARGEVYGLLNIETGGADAAQRLEDVAPIAAALADAMSLALANIALRERLRTQALRDPLTGLYNRRYMEDVLERYSNLAERNESPLSVVMIDLDHFKALNDEHGHALGDAVLCEVSAAIMSSIRPCDVACRYGGEELVVLLPDCGNIEALAKAEILRARIERLSENHGTQISASFGVATIPETSSKAGDVIADADGALYEAKSAGRNRVASAGKSALIHAAEAGPAVKVA